jgi:hypothetical protein
MYHYSFHCQPTPWNSVLLMSSFPFPVARNITVCGLDCVLVVLEPSQYKAMQLFWLGITLSLRG